MPAKAGGIKAVALTKKPAAKESDRTGQSKSFGQIRVGPFSEKSYLQKKEGKKWKLLVNVCHPDKAVHQRVAWKLFHHALQSKTTQETLTNMKDEWLARLAKEESSGESEEITNDETSEATIEDILAGSLLQESSDKALEESIDGILTTTEISTAVLESPPFEDPSTTSATPSNACSLTDFGCCTSNQT